MTVHSREVMFGISKFQADFSKLGGGEKGAIRFRGFWRGSGSFCSGSEKELVLCSERWL